MNFSRVKRSFVTLFTRVIIFVIESASLQDTNSHAGGLWQGDNFHVRRILQARPGYGEYRAVRARALAVIAETRVRSATRGHDYNRRGRRRLYRRRRGERRFLSLGSRQARRARQTPRVRTGSRRDRVLGLRDPQTETLGALLRSQDLWVQLSSGRAGLPKRRYRQKARAR